MQDLPPSLASLGVFWHPDVLLHDTGSGVFEAGPSPLQAVPERHPENAGRVENMKAILERGPIADRVRWREGRHATVEELETVHDAGYVARIRALSEEGGHRIARTMPVEHGTWPAACAAAG